jgi:predicted ribosomally synthesized peptide with SipW-like signal peptide
MKRILLSLAMVSLAGSVAAIGSTGAFFSDSETSTGNIFTAGSIDLKIDHSVSTYNGSSDLVVVSDPATTFTGDDGSGNAVNLSFVHPAWETIPGANWIWATDPVSNPNIDQTDTFTRTFTWNGPVANATIEFGADNFYNVKVNGNLVGDNQSLIVGNFQSPHTTDVTAYIVQGVNTITFVGKNYGINGSVPSGNPAGIIFKLVVHGQQTFGPTDLTTQTFWNFNDVKPQDTGRDVISMHVSTNDAWSCMVIKNIKNNENTLIAPEVTAGDVTPGVAGVGGGELGGFLHLFLWHDNGTGVHKGDGIYDPGFGETPITGTLATPTTIDLSGPGPIMLPVHDSTTLPAGPLLATTEDDVGSAWCAGTLSVDAGTGAITCNGAIVSNNSQTDSTLADLVFYATQQRNQPNFKCSDVSL